MRFKVLSTTVLSALFCAGLSMPAFSQTALPSEKAPWLALVTKQMAEEKSCDVGFLSTSAKENWVGKLPLRPAFNV